MKPSLITRALNLGLLYTAGDCQKLNLVWLFGARVQLGSRECYDCYE